MILSLIIPFYNASQYMPVCISSLKKQLTENMELLLINDGSNDGSDELCEKLIDGWSIARIINQNHCGVAVARQI